MLGAAPRRLNRDTCSPPVQVYDTDPQLWLDERAPTAHDPVADPYSFMLRDWPLHPLGDAERCPETPSTPGIEFQGAIDRGHRDEVDGSQAPGMGLGTADAGAFGGPSNIWDPASLDKCVQPTVKYDKDIREACEPSAAFLAAWRRSQVTTASDLQ